jgi:hypothetical protein
MNWGDVPAWVAIAVSLLASGQAWWARREARQATAGAASLEVSLQRIADAMERSLAAGQHRSSVAGSAGRPGTASEPAPPAPEFNLEFVAGHAYRLRNVSTVRATGVTVTIEGAPQSLARTLPVNADLPPLASAGPFSIQASRQARMPEEVLVACDQLPEPIRVTLPPRE